MPPLTLDYETPVIKYMIAKHGPNWTTAPGAFPLATFWQQNFERKVGPRNWHIRMSKLVPSPDSSLPEHVQAKCISVLKSSPDDSYLILGPAGCSKTTYAVALFDHALRQHHKDRREGGRIAPCPIWWCEVKELLDQFVGYATKPEGRRPQPNAQCVKELFFDGFRPRLFLEEMDKAKVSDYKLGELFALINAVYNHNGQIVVTSNMPKEEFIATFDAPIFRRLTEMKADGADEKSTSHFWDFYKHVGHEK